jgi:uncharacterized protein YwgA
MDAEALVLSLLDILPSKEIRGRKRLQKLAYFALSLGAPAQARFFLYDFGPFSAEIAYATQMLTLLGEIDEEDVVLGNTKTFVKTYKLHDVSAVRDRLPSEVSREIAKLLPYSTVELEIASTILFFHGKGLSWANALESTKELKPTKSVPQVISRAMEALAEVGLYEGRGTDSVSGT